MMKYDFDTSITRRGTGSLKWDRRADLDPFWVADLDFVSPPEVVSAITERVNHGVFGYAVPHEGLNDAIQTYLQEKHQTEVAVEEIVHLGGLVPALSLACRAFAQKGDAVMTCTPIYPPFIGVHQDAGLELITVNHTTTNGKAGFDWQAMEDAVTPQTKLFLFCNPQNPLGRVFTVDEVQQLAEFCDRHDLILVSDEIHADMIFDEQATPHYSALRLADEFQKRVITLLAPSKTYNIAGLGYSFAVIQDDSLRRRFMAARGHTLPEINCISYYAAEAAYREGEPWRLELMKYLKGNYDLVKSFMNEQFPEVDTMQMEATYLFWMDFRKMGIDNPAKIAEEQAQLFLSDGAFFGRAGCCLFNFGSPRARVIEGLEKLKSAFSS